MRKSAVLVGFGAFFLTLALLLKFVAYDRLAVVPIDTNTRQTLTDPHASYFDVPSLTFKKGKLTTVETVVADKDASEDYGHNTVVLNVNQVTNPAERFARPTRDHDGKFLATDAFAARTPINRHTGLPVDCCNSRHNGEAIQRSGYTIKFPFDTQKKTYPYWDTTLLAPMNLAFKGEEKIRGLKVYRFEGTVPETVYKKEATPGFVFGMAKDSPGQNADRSYTNVRTVWVEPVTGAYIKLQEHQRQFLTIPNHPKVTVVDTVQLMDDATVKSNVDEYQTKSRLLGAVHGWVPWALGLLGLGLLLIGLLVALMSRHRREGQHAEGARWADDEESSDEPTYADDTYAPGPAGSGEGAASVADGPRRGGSSPLRGE